MNYTGKLLTVVSIFFLACCSPQVNISKENLDFCVKDYSKYGCHLAIKVKIDSTSYPCVVRNSDMFMYYVNKEDISEEKYENMTRLIILGKREIVISHDDSSNYGFKIVKIPSPITKELKKGRRFILENYFKPGLYGGYVVKSSVPVEYWDELIYTLFDYGIIAGNYHESGYLYLPEKQFEK